VVFVSERWILDVSFDCCPTGQLILSAVGPDTSATMPGALEILMFGLGGASSRASRPPRRSLWERNRPRRIDCNRIDQRRRQIRLSLADRRVDDDQIRHRPPARLTALTQVAPGGARSAARELQSDREAKRSSWPIPVLKHNHRAACPQEGFPAARALVEMFAPSAKATVPR